MKWIFIGVLCVACLSAGCQHMANRDNKEASLAVVELSYEPRMFHPGRSLVLFADGDVIANDYGTIRRSRVESSGIKAVAKELRDSGFFSFRQEAVLEELDRIWTRQNVGAAGPPRPPVVSVDGSTVCLSMRWMDLSNRVVWANFYSYHAEWPGSTNVQKFNGWISLVENLNRPDP